MGVRAIPFSAIDLLAGLVFTWVLGLAPAFIARRIKKGPLRSRQATVIALISCFCFAVIGVAIKEIAGEPARVSPAWVLVFFVSRWIMTRSERQPFLDSAGTSVASGTPGQKLSHAQTVARLREMVLDPSTADHHRREAENKLEEYERRETRKTSAQRKPRPELRLSVIGLSSRSWRWPVRILVIAAAADLALILSGYRILIRERVVQPGESYIAGEWGDLGTYDDKPIIACWYWTGRKLIPEAFFYGPGKLDRDECTALHNHKPGE